MQPSFTARKTFRRPRLMIPGPVDVSDAVLSAMATQVVAHYGADWTALYKETTAALRSVFKTAGDVFVMPGPGSVGLDAAINSLFLPGEKVLVTLNGFFGDRLVQLAGARGLQVVAVAAEWGKPVDPALAASLLSGHEDIAGIIAVHHETSTGVLNPVRELGELARKAGIPLIVDAISSLGGEELPMDDWGIDICVAASNKCLESLPGVSPVAVGANAWRIIAAKECPHPGWYLNLRTWRQYLEEWGSWHPTPVTMPTAVVFALNAALEELAREGLENRIRRYRQVATNFRQEVRRIGFELYVDGVHASSCVSSICSLPGMKVDALLSWLREEKQIQVAGGLGQTKGSIFRVGHIGKAATQPYVQDLLAALQQYCQGLHS